MKRKITTIENLTGFLANQDWEIKPFDYSPIPEITLPPKFEFIAGSASFSQISNYSGASIAIAGMDIFRRDLKDYPYVINANHYSIYSTGDKKLFEIIEDKPNYHWVKSFSEIPQDILQVIPPTTIKNLESLLKEQYTDVLGLAVDKDKKT
jgi:hypothetical protein